MSIFLSAIQFSLELASPSDTNADFVIIAHAPVMDTSNPVLPKGPVSLIIGRSGFDEEGKGKALAIAHNMAETISGYAAF